MCLTVVTEGMRIFHKAEDFAAFERVLAGGLTGVCRSRQSFTPHIFIASSVRRAEARRPVIAFRAAAWDYARGQRGHFAFASAV